MMPEQRIRPIRWQDDRIVILDQTLLPQREEYLTCRRVSEVAEAIRALRVRGAPLIGIAAAYAIALAAQGDPGGAPGRVEQAAELLRATRPTARNLFWAIDRMVARAREGASAEALRAEALAIHSEDAETCRRIGAHGAELLKDGARVLTICNAGALATGGSGTALGVLRAAHATGKRVEVLACETRPLLQGARLTMWELMKDGIPSTLITDGMAGACLARGMVDVVITGADRIARNGDAANKIGTYALAVLARHHHVAFYVAAPMSTVDLSLADGTEIPIEERDGDEVRGFRGTAAAPPDAPAFNPAFDVTPAALIRGIITERGVLGEPYEESFGRH